MGGKIFKIPRIPGFSSLSRFDKCSIVVILLFGLLVFTWFDFHLLIDDFDYDFALNPTLGLVRSLHLWDNYANIGVPNPRAVAGLLPNNIYYYLTSLIGMPLYLSQRLFFYAVISLPGLSIFILYKCLG